MKNTKRISRTKFIEASPDDLWATLAKFDEIASWASNVDQAAYTTTQTEGVGTARRVKSGPMTLIETVTEWEPGHRLTYTLVGLPPIVRSVSNSWLLEPSRGGTRVTLSTTLERRRWLPGRIAAAILALVMADAANTLLDGLAERARTRT